MRQHTIVPLTLVLVFATLAFAHVSAAAQQASPVAGNAGGTLYTFDSGEAG